MKKLFVKFYLVLIMFSFLISVQKVSARQGIPCDPDDPACPPVQNVPLDTNVIYLLVGGIALYLVARARDKKVTA